MNNYSLKIVTCLFFYLFYANGLYSQIETDRIFPLLNMATSARMAAHGGYAIASIDHDVNTIYTNPAFYEPEDQFDLSFNNQFQFLKTGIGNVTIGKKIHWNNLIIHGGVQYADYASVAGYDDNGQPIGNISANEYNIIAGASMQLYENMRVGSSVKFINSNLAEYTSNGLAIDIGMAYHVPESPATLGFAVRNIGGQLSVYNKIREPMPLDIQASGSLRLKHLPLRIGMVVHHLERWNLLYDNPYDVQQSISIDNQFAEPEIVQYGFVDNFFRHLVFQTELIMGKNDGFKLRMGYNHLRKRELTVNGFRSLAGFSGGMGIRIYRFNFDYGLAIYHIAGVTHTLTLTTDLNSFKKSHL